MEYTLPERNAFMAIIEKHYKDNNLEYVSLFNLSTHNLAIMVEEIEELKC